MGRSSEGNKMADRARAILQHHARDNYLQHTVDVSEPRGGGSE